MKFDKVINISPILTKVTYNKNTVQNQVETKLWNINRDSITVLKKATADIY